MNNNKVSYIFFNIKFHKITKIYWLLDIYLNNIEIKQY